MLQAEILLSIIMVVAFVIVFSIPKWKKRKNEKLIAMICTAAILLCQIILLVVYILNGEKYEYISQIFTIIPWIFTFIIGIILCYLSKVDNNTKESEEKENS